MTGTLEEMPELDGARQDALLVASELVTNAVRHSRCPADERLTVRAYSDDGVFSISVVDPGLSGREAELVERPPDAGGLGLRVVQALARRWGAERRPDGYRVWAELSVAGGAVTPAGNGGPRPPADSAWAARAQPIDR